jgi:DNA adenine methylase
MPKSGKTPLRWYGGKQNLAKRLISLIPDHHTYVEAFAGGAAVFFVKEISPLEVINDLDSGIVNFYRVLRDPGKFKLLQDKLILTPFSREEFEYCRDTWMECEDDVDKAHRWYVMIRQSFGGLVGGRFGNSVTRSRNGMAQNAASYRAALDRLPEVAARLIRAQIEHLDFRKIIEKYDRPGTFFYLDPPYIPDTRKAPKVYQHEMSDQDHRELVDLLLSIKGKAMLSGYAHPIYLPLEEAGWGRKDFPVKSSFANGTRKAASNETSRIESVWVRN